MSKIGRISSQLEGIRHLFLRPHGGQSNRWLLTAEEMKHYGIESSEALQAQYLSFRAFSRGVRPLLADPEWAALLDNKIFFGAYFESMGLPVPKTLGLLHPEHGFFSDGGRLRSIDDLVARCRSGQLSEFVLKPVAGWNSEGILVVVGLSRTTESVVFELADGHNRRPEALEEALVQRVRGAGGNILQERLSPHPWFDSVGLATSNVIRVVTFHPRVGPPEIQAAVLFAGRVGQMVNSWQEGALSIHVDLTSGKLGKGRMLPRFDTEWLTNHPDTRSAFTGAVLPDWDEVRKLCLRSARLTPGLRLVCWEVFVTESGPVVLEGNLGFGLTMFQVHTGGLLGSDIADAWAEAGADLPDGSDEWLRRHAWTAPWPYRIAARLRAWLLARTK